MRGRWCDRYETKGKRSGAFSSSSYGAPPYILMNYKEDVFADIYTLAHEAGHSMHTWFSQKSQTFQDYDYPIFLAEVASTFNEELLTHYLLAQTNDRKMRAYIINRQVDDIRGTLFRQTMFAEFEKIIHAIEESGDALTLDLFKSEYHKAAANLFRGEFRARPAARPRMPPNSAFLSCFLCLQIRHRNFGGGCPLRAGVGGDARSGRGVFEFPGFGRIGISARCVAGGRGGHGNGGAGREHIAIIRAAFRGTGRRYCSTDGEREAAAVVTLDNVQIGAFLIRLNSLKFP